MGRIVDADALKEKFPLPPEMWEMRGQQTLWLAREIRETIDLMPTVKPKQRWIPCSERMPEDLEEVNVTWVNHDPEPYYNFVKDKPFTGSAVYYKEKWYWYSSKCADILCEYGENDIDEVDDAIEIIAWMPLPEPYREDSEADGDG